MTLWQDPPPQTRRQARETERTAARGTTRRAGTAEPTPGGEIPAVTTAYNSRPVKTEARDEDEQPAIPATAFADPGVTSPTRQGAPAQRGDFDALISSNSDAATTGGTDQAPSPLFRQAADPNQPLPVTQPMAVVTPSARGLHPADPQNPATPPEERTLTRRELRAMMQAQEANQQSTHAPAPGGAPVFPVTFTPDVDAVAPAPGPTLPEAPAGDSRVTQSSSSPFTAFGTAQTPRQNAPEPADDTALLERRPFTPPTGHWSTAAELDADEGDQPIISRSVGQSTAATTTNALILPSLPKPDATGPLTSTGEILVTGSIDLPRGMGSTGAHPSRIDSSDLDRLLDGEENEFNTSEVAPVRASRAIATNTSTRGVITPPKKRGNTLPLVLMITAGVLAVGVIGLLVAAYVLKVF